MRFYFLDVPYSDTIGLAAEKRTTDNRQPVNGLSVARFFIVGFRFYIGLRPAGCLQASQDASEDADGLPVFGEVQVFVGSMVQTGVAGAERDDGAVPGGADDVHVRRSALDLEDRPQSLGAHGLEEGAHQGRILLGAV